MNEQDAPNALKDKRNWFHSLTRRRKSPPSQHSSSSTNDTHDAPQQQQQQNNNNNIVVNPNASRVTNRGSVDEARTLKRKDDHSIFQRLRKKIGLRFSSLRQRHYSDDDDDDDDGGGDGRGLNIGGGATTDASSEFLTHSPRREAQHLSFSFTSQADLDEFVPFTHNYMRFIKKKWLERDNRVMYKASSEMLSQVWYWGEISRRDAQKQLTDKPTGSFLVRDSETSGCQFTLSFRIVNVTLHYRLEYRDSYWHFEELQYESIVEMIEDILYRCTNDNYICFVKVPNEMQPQFPVILKYPLSRYMRIPYLQDMCRRVIQWHSSPDEMAKLPIPPKLLEYLSEKRELVFQS